MTTLQKFEFGEIVLAFLAMAGNVFLVVRGNPDADRHFNQAQQNTQLVSDTVTKLNDQFTAVIELMRTLVKKL